MILSTQLLVISAFGTVGAGRDNAAARCYAAEPPGDPRSRPPRERPAGTERGCAAAALASSWPLGPRRAGPTDPWLGARACAGRSVKMTSKLK